MDWNAFLKETWMPLAISAFCLLYGLRVLTSKDVKIIKRDLENKVFKDKDSYCKYAAILLFVISGASLIMSFMLMWNSIVATVFIMTAFVVVTILWKRMEAKYGPL